MNKHQQIESKNMNRVLFFWIVYVLIFFVVMIASASCASQKSCATYGYGKPQRGVPEHCPVVFEKYP